MFYVTTLLGEYMFIAIRDVLLKSLGFNDVFEGLRHLGLNSIELALDRELKAVAFHNIKLKDFSSINEFKSLLKENNIHICALLLGNDLGSENLEKELKYIKSSMEIAKELGVKVVRVNAVMKLRPNWTLSDALKVTVKALKEASEYDKKIWLAVENHGIISNKREFLRSLFENTKGFRIGLTLDTCNFYWYGYPLTKVYEIYEEFAKYVKHTHIKNATAIGPRDSFRKPGEVQMKPLYEGDIDLKRTVLTLMKSGYEGDLTIEDESLGHYSVKERRKIIVKDIQFLERILKEVEGV